METYTICTHLYLTSFTHHVHETHPCCVSEVCSFLLFSSIPLCEYTRCVHLFSCSWTLGCFAVWAIMNKAAMNILKQVFGGHRFSFILDKEISRSGIAGSKGRRMFHFVRKAAVPYYVPTSSTHELQLFPTLTNICIVRCLNFSHSSERVAVSPCGFSLYFLSNVNLKPFCLGFFFIYLSSFVKGPSKSFAHF